MSASGNGHPPGPRRVGLLAVVALAASVALTGCASKPHPASRKVEITFWSWANTKPAVDLWNKTHPDIQVKYVTPASGTVLFQALASAEFAGKGIPDVVQVDYHNLPTLVAGNELQDITGYASSAKANFVAAAWNVVTPGGKVWAIPQDLGPVAMYYRKDIFAKYRLPVPTTWDQYAQVARRLHAADPTRYIAAFPPADASWFASRAWEAGAQWFSTGNDAWHVTINSTQTKRVAQFWQDLVTSGAAKVDTDWSPSWFKGFQDGTYATWLSASWGAGPLKTNAPKTSGDWAVSNLPQWTPDATLASFWGGSANAVPRGAKHAKEAVEFAVWLNSNAQASSSLIPDPPAGGGLFPASLAGQANPLLDKPDPFFGGQTVNSVFRTAATQVPPWVWGPTMDQVYSDLGDDFTKALEDGTSLASALDQVQAQTVAALQKKGLQVVG